MENLDLITPPTPPQVNQGHPSQITRGHAEGVIFLGKFIWSMREHPTFYEILLGQAVHCDLSPLTLFVTGEEAHTDDSHV